MDIKVEPLKVEEVDDYIRVQWDAFEPLEANMIMPMLFPKGLQPDVMERLGSRVLNQENLENRCFCAKDATSNQIVGVSWWAINNSPPQNKGQIDAKFDEVRKAKEMDPPVEGMHTELERAYFKTAFYCEMETTGGKPYMCLRLLAVHPNHQRRAIGSLLLRQGLERADRSGLPVYLDSAVMGKPLYERHGFKVTSEMPLDCLEYGGRSDGKHWCMLRPAQIEDRNGTA